MAPNFEASQNLIRDFFRAVGQRGFGPRVLLVEVVGSGSAKRENKIVKNNIVRESEHEVPSLS